MSISPTSSPPSPWSQLLPELLGRVVAQLPFPGDRARFRAVCRAWHSAARHYARRLPWLVLPDGSFCTAGDDGAYLHHETTIPGLPEQDVTCVGSTDAWLALDCNGDEAQRDNLLGKLCSCCCCKVHGEDVKQKPSYILHNPFSGATVPLPELDSIISSVSRRFRIRKVLMRSSSPDDVIAVVTNNWNYNIILFRPGKGTDVLCYYRVVDIAFLGDWLYGITPGEDLFAFRLAEDDDGKPIVAEERRFIKNPLPEGKEDYWSWIDDDSDDDDEDGDGGDPNEGNDGGASSSSEEGEEDVDDDEAQNKGDGATGNDEGELNSNAEEKVDDEAQNKEEEDRSSGEEEGNSSGDGMISDDEVIVCDEESPNDPKDYIITRRILVKSRAGELLMVRQHVQVPQNSSTFYTGKVEIFKADISAGKWLPITGSCLAEDEALLLSRSFSKSTHVHGDIKAGFIYFDHPTDVFDTTSWGCAPSSLPEQINLLRSKWSTWIFPQELVV